MPFRLDLVPGGGSLQIRDAEEAYPLERPTTVAGTVAEDTGVIAGGTFATPQVSFEQEVSSPLSATAFIDATFSQVAPGAASGTVDDQGEMAVDLQLTVDLHIEVVPTGATTPIALPGDCRATPVALNLVSHAPYDPETRRVTLVDPDFTVPPVAVDSGCVSIIADAINAQLAGSGHALSLVLEGDVVLPPPAGCATTTTVEVSPAGGASVGDDVTLTAAVVPVADDPECEVAASDGVPLVGAVELRDGASVVATAPLDASGRASATTAALPAGTRTLTARYRGSPPYQASTSAPTAYAVQARPLVSTTLPPVVQVGAAPVEFDLTVTNTDFGRPVEGARLDLTIRRAPPGSGAFTAPMVSLEVADGTSWVPVTLAEPAARTVLGSIGAAGAFDAAPGEAVTRRVRIAVGSGGAPAPSVGPFTLSFELVDGGAPPAVAPTAAPLAAGSTTVTVAGAERIPTTIGFSIAALGGPVNPHTVRSGYSISLPGGTLTPSFSGVRPGGSVAVLLDSVPIPSSRGGQDPLLVHPLGGGTPGTFVMDLPVDLAPGTHTLTVTYSGDLLFAPTAASVPFTVLPPVGAVYECSSAGSPPHHFRAHVVAQAGLPSAAPAGSTVELDRLSVKLLTDRGFQTVNGFSGMLANDAVNHVGDPVNLEGVAFALGPDGSGTATGIDRRLGTRMPPEPNPATTEVDHSLTFLGETGSVVIDGALGDVVPVTLDEVRIDLRTTAGGIPYVDRCVPVGDPIVLGEVEVAGVGLTVEPGGPVRAGRPVTLSAVTAPAAATGVVEFRDGTSTLGVVPVAGGRAAVTTDALAPGDHVLTARFFPQPMMAVLASDPVALAVLPELDCGEFASAGSGAVVRLAYLELLGRCPDAAGYGYWKGRLDAGTSPEAFARAIAATPEAVGRVVDDAYVTMLGRRADAAGRAFWTARLSASGRYDALLADLGASSELWSRAGATNEGFVVRVYDRLLGRAPDAAGLTYWVGRLDAGASRRALIVSLANLDEPLGRTAAASYRQILDRAPYEGERRDAIAFLRSTGDRSGLHAQLIGRPEFTTRAQGFPNPAG